MKSANFLALSFVILCSLALGCAPEWKDPMTSTPHKELEVQDILVTPNVFDSAGIEVRGKVWALTYGELRDSESGSVIPYTTFKLADREGNFIPVFGFGDFPIAEGDIVYVLGIYRRDYKSKHHNFKNEIEALRIERASSFRIGY